MKGKRKRKRRGRGLGADLVGQGGAHLVLRGSRSVGGETYFPHEQVCRDQGEQIHRYGGEQDESVGGEHLAAEQLQLGAREGLAQGAVEEVHRHPAEEGRGVHHRVREAEGEAPIRVGGVSLDPYQRHVAMQQLMITSATVIGRRKLTDVEHGRAYAEA